MKQNINITLYLPNTTKHNNQTPIRKLEMANNDSPQSNDDISISMMPLPPQSPAPPEPSLDMTASPNEAAPQTFHRFPDLPAELRIAVWELSLPHRVHTFPLPSQKFDFLDKSWIQERVHGAKAEKRPAIAHVCSEARAVALESGSVKMIRPRIRRGSWQKPSRVWVHSKKDTVVINMGHATVARHCSFNHEDLYSLLSKRDMRIALDSSWALCFCMFSEDHARKLYDDLVHGHTECDLVIWELQFDVTNEEAADIGLFEGLGPYNSVLVPIEDTRRMSRLLDAQAKFNNVNWLDKWESFTQFRKPTNLDEFTQRWKKLAVREMRNVQLGLDFLTGVETGRQDRQGKDVDELREQAARAAVIRAEHPKFRPVIMVSRGLETPQ